MFSFKGQSLMAGCIHSTDHNIYQRSGEARCLFLDSTLHIHVQAKSYSEPAVAIYQATRRNTSNFVNIAGSPSNLAAFKLHQ